MQSEVNNIVTFLIVTTCLILLLCIFIITILYLYKRKQVAFQENLERLKIDYEKNLLKTQLEIHEQTLQQISREIHDNIGLSLTLAKLHLNTINLNNEDQSSDLINFSIDLISKSINDLSDISKSLNGEIIANNGLIKALEIEINKLKKLNCFNIQFTITGNPVFLDSQKELVLFRIVQEALNNVLKHAHAKNIHVGLHYHTDHINLMVRDDGSGFEHLNAEKRKEKNMSGLINMSHRAQLLNGSCTIESKLNKGTTIKIAAPFYN